MRISNWSMDEVRSAVAVAAQELIEPDSRLDLAARIGDEVERMFARSLAAPIVGADIELSAGDALNRFVETTIETNKGFREAVLGLATFWTLKGEEDDWGDGWDQALGLLALDIERWWKEQLDPCEGLLQAFSEEALNWVDWRYIAEHFAGQVLPND